MNLRASILLAVPLLFSACATTSGQGAVPSTAQPLEFREDDLAGALAEAKAKNVPLFVDGWAPWCHSCLSMKEAVLKDPSLGEFRDRFVFLAVNTDKVETGGPFLERYPMEGWPTLFVIDPATEKPLLKWLGTATLPQLRRLLEDSERTKKGGLEGADALLSRGDLLSGEGKKAEAAGLYEQALAAAPSEWARRERALESVVIALSGADQHEACARRALAAAGTLPRSPAFANVSLSGLYCAMELDTKAPARAELQPALEAKVKEAIGEPLIPITVDDRSGLYEALLYSRESSSDEAGKKEVAAKWIAYLEDEAKRAPTPAVRAVYDTHRFSAAMALGAPERAIPALEQSEKDFPHDYNPPARLGNLYRAAGRLDDALAANTRALERVEGPRKARLLNDRAEIFLARNEPERAKEAWSQVVAHAKSLPASQQPKRELAKAEGKLAALQSK